MTFPTTLATLLMAGLTPAASITGKVVENASGKPVSGAFVAVSWSARGADMVGSRTTCTDVQVTKTDDRGEFRVHGRSPSTATVMVFKAGLQTHNRSIDKNERWEIRTAPFASSIDVRKREYDTIWFLIACGNQKEARRKVRPIGEEIDKDFASVGGGRAPYFIRRLDEAETLTD